MKLTNISTIKELMHRHGMNFSKSLGQNFLINPTIVPRMVEESGIDSTTGVLEIGPGIGVLTQELATRSAKVVAIELDKRLLPILEETLDGYDNVTVVEGDALKLDLKELLATHFPQQKVAVCANLPYYITSPILMRLLEEELPLSTITAMVQKEAAQRIAAPIPSRNVGAITLSAAYYATSEILFTVSPGSFLPAPKVESAVLKLSVRNQPPVPVKKESFRKVVRAAFSQRRKTLNNSLSAGLQLDKPLIKEIFDQLQIPGSHRGEQLTLEQFGQLALLLEERKLL